MTVEKSSIRIILSDEDMKTLDEANAILKSIIREAETAETMYISYIITTKDGCPIDYNEVWSANYTLNKIVD